MLYEEFFKTIKDFSKKLDTYEKTEPVKIYNITKDYKVQEIDGNLKYFFNVAGFKKGEINVDVDKSENTIVVRCQAAFRNFSNYLESSLKEFYVDLPDDSIDYKFVEGSLEDGILELTFAKHSKETKKVDTYTF